MTKLLNIFLIWLSLIYLCLPANCWAQSVISEVDESSYEDGVSEPTLVTETIKKISQTRRIFAITNENESFNEGDYISLVFNGNLVARALVAKIREKGSGIKMVTIYSVEIWERLYDGLEIQVLRGDDSYYRNRKTKSRSKRRQTIEQDQFTEDTITPEIDPLEEPSNKGIIKSEEDLFNETVLSEDSLEIDENPTRGISSDNVLSVSYGLVEGLTNGGVPGDRLESETYPQLSAHYAFQMADNLWVEAGYGYSYIADYPISGIDTRYTSFTFKAKYCLSMPFYSYILPYVGYQMRMADSPDAGNTTVKANEELDAVDALEENTFIIGLTVLKRVVPGWFFRGDIGMDVLSIGMALEF